MELWTAAYGSADAQLLTAEVQAEYAHRYGSEGDEAPIDMAEFAPPDGLFVIAYDEDRPVGMGGWRRLGDEAEIKRMYVREPDRRRGVARQILTHLEHTAAEAGVRHLALETGHQLPGAIDLYLSSGYSDISPFGYYRDSPDSRFLGKSCVL